VGALTLSIQCACPNCRKRFSTRDEYAGKRAKCPACKTPFTVPPQIGGTAKRAAVAVDKSTATPKVQFAGSSPKPATRDLLEVGQRNGEGEETEKHLWSGRPSQIINLSTFITSGFLALLGFLPAWLVVSVGGSIFFALSVFFVWISIIGTIAGWRYLEVHHHRYELSEQRLRLHRGVLSRRIDDLELYRVKDTTFIQPWLQRLFGKASILITTSDVSTPNIYLVALSAETAQRIRGEIRENTERLRERKQVREIDFNRSL